MIVHSWRAAREPCGRPMPSGYDWLDRNAESARLHLLAQARFDMDLVERSTWWALARWHGWIAPKRACVAVTLVEELYNKEHTRVAALRVLLREGMLEAASAVYRLGGRESCKAFIRDAGGRA